MTACSLIPSYTSNFKIAQKLLFGITRNHPRQHWEMQIEPLQVAHSVHLQGILDKTMFDQLLYLKMFGHCSSCHTPRQPTEPDMMQCAGQFATASQPADKAILKKAHDILTRYRRHRATRNPAVAKEARATLQSSKQTIRQSNKVCPH